MNKTSKQPSKILLKSSFIFLLLLFGCTSAYEKTFKDVAKIDQANGVSLSDYNEGLTHFDKEEREGTIVNPEDLDKVMNDLETLKIGAENSSLAYLDFRIALFSAEKNYKIAARKPFAHYDGPVRCSYANATIESVSSVRMAIAQMENATNMYEQNSWDFMPENWTEVVMKDNLNISSRADWSDNIAKNKCNQSQTPQ